MVLAIGLTVFNAVVMILGYMNKYYKCAMVSAIALGMSIGLIFNALNSY